jgi:hypothetical protein
MQSEFNTHAEAIIHTVFFAFLSVRIDSPVIKRKSEVGVNIEATINENYMAFLGELRKH